MPHTLDAAEVPLDDGAIVLRTLSLRRSELVRAAATGTSEIELRRWLASTRPGTVEGVHLQFVGPQASEESAVARPEGRRG